MWEIVGRAADVLGILSAVVTIGLALLNRLQPNAKVPNDLFWTAVALGVAGLVFLASGVKSRLDVTKSFEKDRGKLATVLMWVGIVVLGFSATGFAVD
jgi:hypothetical protein